MVCSRSTLSWLAAFFNDENVKTYMPKNYLSISHETFQYPNDNTEIFDMFIDPKTVINPCEEFVCKMEKNRSIKKIEFLFAYLPSNPTTITKTNWMVSIGISDEQLASPIDAPTATKLNSRNINFLYTAIGLIFVTFVIALVFIFISFQKIRGSTEND